MADANVVPLDITVAVVSGAFGLAVLFITLFFQSKKERSDADWRYAELFLKEELERLTALLLTVGASHEAFRRFLVGTITKEVTLKFITEDIIKLNRVAARNRLAARPYLEDSTRQALDNYRVLQGEVLSNIQVIAKKQAGDQEVVAGYSSEQRHNDIEKLDLAYERFMDELGNLLYPEALRKLRHKYLRKLRQG